MKYLIDTHTLLWITTNDPKLSPLAKNIYLDTGNEILVSMASIWELAIKSSMAKISFKNTLEGFVQYHVIGNNIQLLGVSLSHLLRVETLPFHHRDPFDRLIISQAIEENMPIIGNDSSFDLYQVERRW